MVLVTRPDLVLPSTAGLSTTAGAWSMLDASRMRELRETYILSSSSLLWFGSSLLWFGSSLWLCNLWLGLRLLLLWCLWLGGSLGLCGLSSGGLLCGCGLLHSRLLVGGLLLGLGLWGSLRSSWLWLLLCELGSSGASCERSDQVMKAGSRGTYPLAEQRHPSRHRP